MLVTTTSSSDEAAIRSGRVDFRLELGLCDRDQLARMFGKFFAGEAFVPLALQTERGVSTAQAGAVLTVGAVGWALGSQVQGRLYGRLPRHRLVQAGAVLVSLCLATVTFSLVPSVPYWVAVVSWILGAAGMGLAFGAVGTLTQNGFPVTPLTMATLVIIAWLSISVPVVLFFVIRRRIKAAQNPPPPAATIMSMLERMAALPFTPALSSARPAA